MGTAGWLAVRQATRRTAVLSGAVLLLLISLAGCAVAQPPSTGQSAPPQGSGAAPAFGTLVSLPEHSAEEARAGVTRAMVELAWARAEPAEGRFDDAYLRTVRDQVDRLRATGRSITLGLGLHATPTWVLALPDGRYVDETGAVSDEANLVFNQRSRLAAEQYLMRVSQVLDLSHVDDVRLTSGGSAEVLYPAGGGYWAFDANAQGGSGRPATLEPNPLPGWRPGQPGVSEADVRRWATWYVGALDDVVTWQADVLNGLGFRGHFQVLTPGVGVHPADFDAAVAAQLPRGLLGVGAAWDQFYAQLPRRPDLVAYVSSVADDSGDDVCEAGDRAVALDSPQAQAWSSARWITRVAGQYGYPMAGENPGWGQSPELDRTYVDLSDGGMLARSVDQAVSCGFQVFYWAHDTQLWDGTVPFAAYAQRIASR